jgi:hypothetical protein
MSMASRGNPLERIGLETHVDAVNQVDEFLESVQRCDLTFEPAMLILLLGCGFLCIGLGFITAIKCAN